MKKILVFALVFNLFSLTYSQNKTGGGVDLHKMFRDQVNEIKKKNARKLNSGKAVLDKLPGTAKVVKKSAGVQKSPNSFVRKKMAKNSKVSKAGTQQIYFKAFILFEASLLASILVMYRRKKIGFKKELRRELKENISLLRTEKLDVKPDKKLEGLRKSLTRKNINLKQGSNSITNLAKKLSIAKGEVHLAIKLNVIAGE